MVNDEGTTSEKDVENITHAIESSKIFNVDWVKIDGLSFAEICPILAQIQPTSLHFEVKNGTIGHEDVVNLKQWKKADIFNSYTYMTIPIENFLHFNHISISLTELTTDDALKICNMLDSSETFYKASITVRDFNLMEIARVFDPENEIINEENGNEELYYTAADGTNFRIHIYSEQNEKNLNIEVCSSLGRSIP